MVKLNFKLADTEPLHLDIGRPERLEKILELTNDTLGEPIGSVLVIRAGKVCGKQVLIEPNDILDIYPALSGG